MYITRATALTKGLCILLLYDCLIKFGNKALRLEQLWASESLSLSSLPAKDSERFLLLGKGFGFGLCGLADWLWTMFPVA